jgi:ATP-dependent Clp protease ATP-binding subunit ClpX
MADESSVDEYPGQQRTVHIPPRGDYLPIHDYTPLTIEKSNGN